MIKNSDDDNCDNDADETIQSCLNLNEPKSFFLYAGAGSGKTRSLVEAVRQTCKSYNRQLVLNGQQISIITYTNAACEEIKQRLEYNPSVDVRTIHSFAWNLIEGFNGDIKGWLAKNILKEIEELEDQQRRGRATSRAHLDRARSIEVKKNRHSMLKEINRFVYSPTGENRTIDSLNHSEVIAMTSDFLIGKKTLRHLLISKFPILLIDESQDTNRHLMDALLHVQAQHKDRFCLGLLGDVMQRIYADGKVGLANAIPTDWAMPAKRMNHRCPVRVVKLINKIRSSDDSHKQDWRSDKPHGHVRLFLLPENTTEKFSAETIVAERMAKLTGDDDWKDPENKVKTLTLEHHMAAVRFGFDGLFEPLYPLERIRTSLLDGSLPGLSFFTQNVLPLANAVEAENPFQVATIMKSKSPLIGSEVFKTLGDNQLEIIKYAKQAVDALKQLLKEDKDPQLVEILKIVSQHNIFDIPDSLAPFIADSREENLEEGEEETDNNEVVTWRKALEVRFSQVKKYEQYVSGKSRFGTHQGVKGLEFPRVMVVISDSEAKGFLFSYEKLFGAKDKSKTDLDNEAAGRETSIDRTRRLLYVTCSRAEESLAIIYYSNQPDIIRKEMIQRGWFEDNEIEVIDPP